MVDPPKNQHVSLFPPRAWSKSGSLAALNSGKSTRRSTSGGRRSRWPCFSGSAEANYPFSQEAKGDAPQDVAVGPNQWCHFGVGAQPTLVYFSGSWDVHRGKRDFDPWACGPRGHAATLMILAMGRLHLTPGVHYDSGEKVSACGHA